MPNSLLTRKEVAHNLLQENLLKNIAKDRIFNNFLTKLTLIIGNLAFKVSSLDEFAKKIRRLRTKTAQKYTKPIVIHTKYNRSNINQAYRNWEG